MTATPPWLPAMYDTDGQPDRVFADLFGVFSFDFIERVCHFGEMDVWYDRKVERGEKYPNGFWHLITRTDYPTKERLFDPPRARRLPWCRPTVVNNGRPEVLVWSERRGRKPERTIVWLRQLDYVVVLEIRELGERRRGSRILPAKRVAYLVTAYHVSGKQTATKLTKSYERSLCH